MPDEIRGEWIVQKNRGTSTMLRDFRKAAPWFALFVLNRGGWDRRHQGGTSCLIGRQFNIRLGAIHRVGAPFWGLSCERADAAPLRPVSVKPVALEHGN
jgi:hypothetical protein